MIAVMDAVCEWVFSVNCLVDMMFMLEHLLCEEYLVKNVTAWALLVVLNQQSSQISLPEEGLGSHRSFPEERKGYSTD